MKYLASSLALAAAVSAVVLPHQQPIGGSQEVIENEQFLLELAPGETKWATEDEKWELRRVSNIAGPRAFC
jgi:leucyl aminopeptidase